jgi:hypothetical protein
MNLRTLAGTTLAAIGLTAAVACGGGAPDTDPTTATTYTPSADGSVGRDFGKSAGEVAASAASKAAPAKAPSAPISVEQQNATEQASSYLDGQAFSRKGLISQLKYEGYSVKASTAAVDSLHVNWNEQAALKAASYLDGQSFSRSGLISQLKYEGFTAAQAAYGVKKAGL